MEVFFAYWSEKMYPVSTAYKTAIEKQFRDESFVKIVFGLIDQDAVSYSTLSDNGHIYYSSLSNINSEENQVTTTYQTLEHNRFILDGGYEFSPESAGDCVYQGYISDLISGDDGNFGTQKPYILMSFSQVVELAALTLDFDEVQGTYPTSITVQAFNDTTEVLNKTYTLTGTHYITPDHIPTCNKIYLIGNTMNLPHRRMRLTRILYGIIYNLTEQDITRCGIDKVSDVMSNVLPKDNFSFTLMDIPRNYDPDNPNSFLPYVETGQEIKCSIGQKLANGTIEWFPLCNRIATGEVKTENIGVATSVEIKASDMLGLLTTPYTAGAYSASGKTLATLAQEVLTFCGYTGEYSIDAYLSGVTTHIPLPNRPCRECLQLIANAGGCFIYTDRLGKLWIKRVSSVLQDFGFDYNNIITVPTLTRTPLLRNVISKYFTATENGGTVTITETPYTKNINELGTDLQISNQLIDNETDCSRYCTEMGNYYKMRNSYAFDDRGFPALDILDVVSLDTNYTVSGSAYIIEQKIEFDGTLKGTTKLLSLSTT